MRIWSVHPKYLDAKGLVALWRETLLAKNVLMDRTKGYVNHPQLIRFKETKNPVKSINYYLQTVWEEAKNRKYNFDSSKFDVETEIEKIPITVGQIDYETSHLMKKLAKRDAVRYKQYVNQVLEVHPLFYLKEGSVEAWERL